MKSTSTSRMSAASAFCRRLKKRMAGKYFALLFAGILGGQALHAEDIYALSGGNLIVFKSENPAAIISSTPLTGVTSGQVIEGLDFRPATGQLFALGYVASSGLAQVYSIDYKTGMATAIGAPVTLAANMVRIGFDFNPTVDRIRVTSFSGQNYRLNPITGGIAATDVSLAYVPGDVHAGIGARIEAAAYTNSFPNATTTTLYYFDYGFDDLVMSPNPNGGTLSTVGNAGIATISGAGLDMDIITNTTTLVPTAFLSAKVAGTANNLYTVNLTTGKASLLGTIGMPAGIDEMAVFLAPPTPKIIYALSTTGNLITFNSNNPSTILSTTALTGIMSGQVVEGLDFRPATGELYAMGYVASSGMAQLYTINLSTGVATAIGSMSMLAANMTNVAIDFNPMADRIRVTAAGGQNYRLHPVTGALAFTDGTLAYGPADMRAGVTPAVAAVAYSNSIPGPTLPAATTIYYYDLGINNLALSTNPNGGVLTTVGTTSLTPPSATGVDMDISSNPGITPNIAFVSASIPGSMTALYSLNLNAGTTMLIDTIGTAISDFAVYVAPPVPSRTVYALSGTNLVKFNSTTPGTVTNVATVSGITTGQVIEGLDFRPATLGLYALGYNSTNGATQVYLVDTTTGMATASGPAIILASGMSRLSVDFNPTVDRIRVVSATGQDYRLNPNDGTLSFTDGNLNYAAGDANFGAVPNINAAAYTNSMSGATTTMLYYYDFNLDILTSTTAPNFGTMNTVGRSGISTKSGNGLDLDIVRTPATGMNTAFLTANVNGTVTTLYTVNLLSGEARLIGDIAVPAGITEMAIRLSGADGGRALPVMMVDFSGRKEGNNSQFKWTTQTEVNNDYFLLERSVDGRNFSAISGRINSAAVQGNSTNSLQYAYNDLTPAKGTNYYRLMQVDKDGKSTYSKSVQIQFNGGYEISTYPNPITSVINVNGFIAEKSDLQIKVTDIYGRMVDVSSLKNQSGNWTVRLNASNLRTGLYYVTVTKDKVVIHTETVQKN